MDTVAAVIVTYNRKSLLEKAVQAVLHQTHPIEHVFIIDNASTDGTSQYLKDAGHLSNPQISYIKLPENTGGAGGFHVGMKRAFEDGYDWLWLMDDDGHPSQDCLEKQLKAKVALEIIGAKVVQEGNHKKLTWTLISYTKDGFFSSTQRVKTTEELIQAAADGIYLGYAAFFNCVLIHRSVVQRVGWVNAKLVIRGDEFEYFLRSRQLGIKIGTQIDAIYYHPYQPFQANKWKFFYAFRNLFYNYTQFPNVTYPKIILWMYLVYRFFDYLTKTPSIHWRYIAHVLNALRWAIKGVLLPYQMGSAPQPLEPSISPISSKKPPQQI